MSQYDGCIFKSFTQNVQFSKTGAKKWKAIDKALWFYAGGGVFRHTSSSFEYLPFSSTSTSSPFSLSHFAVYCIHQDRRGNVWFGTQAEGVWKYDGNTFTNFTTKNGLTSNAVNSLFKDQKGAMWFGRIAMAFVSSMVVVFKHLSFPKYINLNF